MVWNFFYFFIFDGAGLCSGLPCGLAGSGGYSLAAVQRLLLAVASLVAEHRL